MGKQKKKPNGKSLEKVKSVVDILLGIVTVLHLIQEMLKG